MHIGMIFAMQEELDAFLDRFETTSTHTYKHLHIYEAKINAHTCLCILSGIGKVNAAYATTLLIHKFSVNMILNSGVAGGVHTDVGTLILSREVSYHDVDVTTFSYEHGQVPGFKPTFKSDTALLQKAENICITHKWPYETGLIASGDQFITDEKPLELTLAIHQDVKAVEMEAAAIAHVACIEGIPFLIIRAISDVIGGSSQAEDFNTFLKKSSKKAAILLSELIHTL